MPSGLLSALEKYRPLREPRVPAVVEGKSGVIHTFSFGLFHHNELDIVGDVLSAENVIDETKVLSLFIKIYDVGAKRAILCVNPGLASEAAKLAKLYSILTIESDAPDDAIRMLEEMLNRLVRAV
jgi:hypothetical protein